MEDLNIRLPALIRDLQDRGYAARDIVILVRRGAEGREMASLLLAEGEKAEEKYNFNVISNDSLYLESNPAVNFLAAMLQYLKNPADPVNLGFLRHEYLRYLAGDLPHDSDLNKIFTGMDRKGHFHRVFSQFDSEYEQIRFMSLYELSEQLIRIFELNSDPGNLPFIQAFQDVVLEFVRNETSDINAFLEYWEKNGSSLTLNISETQDAIRIMTIHKSKGLQFKVVLIPFCHWSLTPETSGSKDLFLWCSTEGTGFGSIKHVPVKYHPELLNSAFREEYLEEKFHAYMDNLNLLYVAFTRAEEELHVFSSTKRSPTAGSLLYEILNQS